MLAAGLYLVSLVESACIYAYLLALGPTLIMAVAEAAVSGGMGNNT